MIRLDYISLLTTRGMLLVALAGAWMAGIVIDSLLRLSPPFFLLLSSLIFLSLILFWQDQRDRLLLLLFLCISLGGWRYARADPQYDPQSVKRFIDTSVGIRGAVIDEPKLQTRTRTLMISVNAVQRTGSTRWEIADGAIEVVALFNGASAEDPYGANYGDSVELHGKLQPPTPISPKNVIASMPFPRIHVSATGSNALIAFIYHLRNQLATLIEQALPQPEAALLIAIFLGLRTPALHPLTFAFNVTGTAHLIVPSGFKVTILSGLVSRSTQFISPEQTGPSPPTPPVRAWVTARDQPFGGPRPGFLERENGRGQSLAPTTIKYPPVKAPSTPLHKSWCDWIRTILVLLSIALYTVLSGAGPAALRAGIMGGLLVVAPKLDRKYNVYTGLAGAAILMSCIDPFVLWDVGFLLSFVGTLGIVLLTPYFQRLLRPIARLPAGSLIIEMTAVTMAAQIATLPIFAVAFQQISLIAPIANILTVPLLGPLILLGLGIGATGFVLHTLSLLCGWIVWPFLWYVQKIIIQCSLLPLAYFHVDSFPAPIAWLYYGLLTLGISFLLYRYPISSPKHHPSLLTARNRRLLHVGIVVLIIVITGINVISPPSTAGDTISFFDIDVAKANGQQHVHGEAIFVRTQDGKTLLIDGGNDSASLSQFLDNQLPSWQHSLDIVMLTSPEQDTITGLQDVLTRYDVGAVFDAGMAHPTTIYARWRRIINERNLQYTPVIQGTTIPLGTTTQLQVLWPQDKLHTGSNEIRDNGLILRLVMPGLRLLLLGSSIQSNYALSGLLTSVDGSMLKADIVQVLGEMNTPVSKALTDVLQHAQPSLVVITSPTQHKSSQSTDNTRSTLSSSLVSVPQVLQTAQQGTIELHSASNSWIMSG